ncbi:MAG TPA: TAT-variant-translocated molybdopterin oxidoreductase [Thermoanaerobaculia bacterium]|nr:TAT-variant-translocated molybdopterin oxidoreductase [Thermoanaerobaculia bacterium]
MSDRPRATEDRGHQRPAPRTTLRVVGEERVAAGAPVVWRSLDELADTPGFRERVVREFPRWAPAEWSPPESNPAESNPAESNNDAPDDAGRRDFLKLAGASISLAGLAACTRQPTELIVPYVEQPPELVPGKPLYYATAMTIGGYATGLLAESHMGRPTKLTGNPRHPASLGGTSALHQAATLGLYDPDRSSSISRRGRILPWEAFVAEMAPVLQAFEALGGDGLRILSGTVASPSFEAMMAEVRQRFPRAVWVQYEPINEDVPRRAARRAGLGDASVRYDLARAQVVVALESDFLASGPGHLRYARDFSRRKRVRDASVEPTRFYAFECAPSPTGTLADHRAPVSPSELEVVAQALLDGLGGGAPRQDLPDWLGAMVSTVVDDLRAQAGQAVVIAGDQAPEEVHVLALRLNQALGAIGSTVLVGRPQIAAPAGQEAAFAELVREMAAGQVDALFVLGANPVYEAPGDLDFAGALAKVDLSVHLGLYLDETGDLCDWHLPQAHFLESWGDARSFDGTLTVIQPLILPLYQGKTDLQLLSALAGRERSDHEIVRAVWERGMLQGVNGDSESAWRRVLHDGFWSPPDASSSLYDGGAVAEPAPPAIELLATPPAPGDAAPAAAGAGAGAGAGASELELALRPDPSLYDGRFANNAWLQELPKPITKLTWDQAALVSPRTAERLGVNNTQVVRLSVGRRSLEAPVWINPGQADGVIVLPLGYGRGRAGKVGNGIGSNALALRSSGDGWNLRAKVAVTSRTYPLSSTQQHFDIEIQAEQAAARHLVQHGTWERFRTEPDFAKRHAEHVPVAPLIPDWPYEGYAWGLSIDLSVCTGCNACIVSCQAENNIPVVGKEQVGRGREMHWLRIDRYYEGELDRPSIHHQPVMCQHCELAPCEVVCPVGATVHGDEGLNEMVYNRCVGTRYCSNNCPYKVRRFNFLRFNDARTPVLEMLRNPDVTVRSRGVMEKCTYCVQRINWARIEAKRENRRIRDGEVKTACQEACPTEAIVFGDVNDPQSEVTRWKALPLDYVLLPEVATKPRTTYLAKVTHPHPSLALAGPAGHGSAGSAHEAQIGQVETR